ncbi:hypothetical protein BH10PSE19_BH10PSE19_09070 [soil metagenome]
MARHEFKAIDYLQLRTVAGHQMLKHLNTLSKAVHAKTSTFGSAGGYLTLGFRGDSFTHASHCYKLLQAIPAHLGPMGISKWLKKKAGEVNSKGFIALSDPMIAKEVNAIHQFAQELRLAKAKEKMKKQQLIIRRGRQAKLRLERQVADLKVSAARDLAAQFDKERTIADLEINSTDFLPLVLTGRITPVLTPSTPASVSAPIAIAGGTPSSVSLSLSSDPRLDTEADSDSYSLTDPVVDEKAPASSPISLPLRVHHVVSMSLNVNETKPSDQNIAYRTAIAKRIALLGKEADHFAIDLDCDSKLGVSPPAAAKIVAVQGVPLQADGGLDPTFARILGAKLPSSQWRYFIQTAADGKGLLTLVRRASNITVEVKTSSDQNIQILDIKEAHGAPPHTTARIYQLVNVAEDTKLDSVDQYLELAKSPRARIIVGNNPTRHAKVVAKYFQAQTSDYALFHSAIPNRTYTDSEGTDRRRPTDIVLLNEAFIRAQGPLVEKLRTDAPRVQRLDAKALSPELTTSRDAIVAAVRNLKRVVDTQMAAAERQEARARAALSFWSSSSPELLAAQAAKEKLKPQLCVALIKQLTDAKSDAELVNIIAELSDPNNGLQPEALVFQGLGIEAGNMGGHDTAECLGVADNDISAILVDPPVVRAIQAFQSKTPLLFTSPSLVSPVIPVASVAPLIPSPLPLPPATRAPAATSPNRNKLNDLTAKVIQYKRTWPQSDIIHGAADLYDALKATKNVREADLPRTIVNICAAPKFKFILAVPTVNTAYKALVGSLTPSLPPTHATAVTHPNLRADTLSKLNALMAEVIPYKRTWPKSDRIPGAADLYDALKATTNVSEADLPRTIANIITGPKFADPKFNDLKAIVWPQYEALVATRSSSMVHSVSVSSLGASDSKGPSSSIRTMVATHSSVAPLIPSPLPLPPTHATAATHPNLRADTLSKLNALMAAVIPYKKTWPQPDFVKGAADLYDALKATKNVSEVNLRDAVRQICTAPKFKQILSEATVSSKYRDLVGVPVLASSRSSTSGIGESKARLPNPPSTSTPALSSRATATSLQATSSAGMFLRVPEHSSLRKQREQREQASVLITPSPPSPLR